jgi:hypothetical protein
MVLFLINAAEKASLNMLNAIPKFEDPAKQNAAANEIDGSDCQVPQFLDPQEEVPWAIDNK